MIFFPLFSSNHKFFKVEGRYLLNKLYGEIRMTTEESPEEMDLDAQYEDRAKELVALGRKLPKDAFKEKKWRPRVNLLRAIDRYKDQLRTLIKARNSNVSGLQNLTEDPETKRASAIKPVLEAIIGALDKTVDAKALIELKRAELNYVNSLISVTNKYLESIAQSQQQALRSS
jgi:hypothetical protein